MPSTYDWIVVGNGITGAAVSYELAATGCSVLLVDRQIPIQGATRYSYGGIAYWSGLTPLMKQLCTEGRSQYPQLSDELGQDIEFRELDLVLTVDADDDPASYEAQTTQFLVPPQRLSVEDACELEPLLNPSALSGAFTVKHGHVCPEAMVTAYNAALQRVGGAIATANVQGFQRQGDRITGIITDQGHISGAMILISNGAWARSLLRSAGIHIPQCFSHAELIETPPLAQNQLNLRTLVMPINIQRFALEAKAGRPQVDMLWDEPGHEVAPPILDAGAIQFQDGRLRIGQITRALTDWDAPIDAAQSEHTLRQAIGTVLPALRDVPGTWHRCRVAFCGDRLPLIGPLPGIHGLHIFSGFSNPFAILPPLAKHYATHVTRHLDPLIPPLTPHRSPLTPVQSHPNS